MLPGAVAQMVCETPDRYGTMAGMEIGGHPQCNATSLELRVRRATPQDAASVAEIHVASWRAGYAGLLPDTLLTSLSVEERTTSWTGYLDESAQGSTFIATSDDTAYGFATVGPGRDDDATPETGELWALYTHPDAWGHGAGAALLTAGLDQLGALGFSRATLWVLTTNQRARRFYEWHGWETDGRSKIEDRGGAPLDHVRYELTDLTRGIPKT